MRMSEYWLNCRGRVSQAERRTGALHGVVFVGVTHARSIGNLRLELFMGSMSPLEKPTLAHRRKYCIDISLQLTDNHFVSRSLYIGQGQGPKRTSRRRTWSCLGRYFGIWIRHLFSLVCCWIRLPCRQVLQGYRVQE